MHLDLELYREKVKVGPEMEISYLHVSPERPSQTVLLIHGFGGLDELSTEGVNRISALHEGEVTTFELEHDYTILVDRTPELGIRDLAGNLLLANQTDGQIRFDILLTDEVNDAPQNVVPGPQTSIEGGSVRFSNGGATLAYDVGAESLLFTEPSHIHRARLGFNVIPVWVGSVPQAVQPVRLAAEPVWLEVDSRLVGVAARGSLRIHPEG